jgi:hypothetical protein
MKKILSFLAAIIITSNLFAQAPQKMSYQAVIRNASNNLVVNAPVKMRISILQGSATGTSVYSELHSTTTNANGLVSIEIGAGTSPTGTFSSINWGNGTFYLKTETDPTNGTNYSIEGTSQLLSVPYALHSGNGVRGVSTSGDTLFLDNGKKFLIPGIKDLNAPPTLNNGLVAYYPFNGNSNDFSGNNYNGTNNETITYTTDRKGSSSSSAQLGSGYITADSKVFQFQRNQKFSVALWFTKETTADGGRLISTECGTGFSGAYYGNFRIAAYSTTGNYAVQFGDYINDLVALNKWTHLVYTFDNRNEKVYIDGVLKYSNFDQATENLNYCSPFTIGAKATPSFDKWQGKIDELRVYDRPLTQEEITYLYNN